MKNQLGAYHLADNPSVYEPVRGNQFIFLITDIDGILNVNSNDNSKINNASKTIEMSVESCPIPHFTQDVITIVRGNSQVHFAGKPQFPAGNIVCNEYLGADAVDVLESWQHLSYNIEEDYVGRAADYKKTCYLIECDNQGNPYKRYKLFGCFITGLSEEALNMTNSDKRQVQANISYDRAVLDPIEKI